jgi:hypothetical protein
MTAAAESKAHLDLREVDLPQARSEGEAATAVRQRLQRDDVLCHRRRRIRDDLAALQPGLERPKGRPAVVEQQATEGRPAVEPGGEDDVGADDGRRRVADGLRKRGCAAAFRMSTAAGGAFVSDGGGVCGFRRYVATCCARACNLLPRGTHATCRNITRCMRACDTQRAARSTPCAQRAGPAGTFSTPNSYTT